MSPLVDGTLEDTGVEDAIPGPVGTERTPEELAAPVVNKVALPKVDDIGEQGWREWSQERFGRKRKAKRDAGTARRRCYMHFTFAGVIWPLASEHGGR